MHSSIHPPADLSVTCMPILPLQRHSGIATERWGEPSHANVVVLGESHLLLRAPGGEGEGTMTPVVVREVAVFDELGVLSQIARKRQGHMPN